MSIGTKTLQREERRRVRIVIEGDVWMATIVLRL